MAHTLHRRSALLGLGALAGCATQGAGPTAPAVPAPVPFEAAVQNATDSVLSATPVATARQPVVIDPLVDGMTGDQSAATQTIQSRILATARARYPQFDFVPFSPQAVARAPHVLVGTFTPVNAMNQPAGAREALRFCLVMTDLASGKTVAKSVVRALPGGLDTSPTAFFRDSPAWTDDASIKSYIETCQGTRVGEPIPVRYVDGLLAASTIAEAIDAYTAGRYAEALDLYSNAKRTRAGDQLRVYNGIYLTNLRLKRGDQAVAAFADLVDYSLGNNRLAVKLLFRTGSTGLVSGGPNGEADMWLRQIAARTAARNTCLQVSGHTSRSGSPELNQRLSLARAEFVKARLEQEAPGLRGRLIATGAGSADNLVGTGADDASDALDRRVEFRVVSACT